VPGSAFAEKQEWGIPMNGGTAMAENAMVRTGGRHAAQ
jgi:hypothetical protein